jgi:hypothetical protein
MASGSGRKWITGVSLTLAVLACADSFVRYQHEQALTQDVAKLQNELKASRTQLVAEVRPDLPVRVAFRRALLGSGQVALLQNLSNREIQVTLEVSAPATGQHFSRPLVIEPNRTREFGHIEGWEFAAGQEVTLNNAQYRPLSVLVGG